jgi:hypothetical protein
MFSQLVRRLVVVSVAMATVLAPALVPVAQGQTEAQRVPCGVWRWDVKTLSDSHNHDVNFTPQAATVQHLRTLHAPGSLSTSTPRIWPVEKKTYRVHAQVLKATIEDDSDIHLIIAIPGSASQTMIVEFPDPHCVASAFKRPAIAAARAALLSNCGAISSSSFTNLPLLGPLKIAARIDPLQAIGHWPGERNPDEGGRPREAGGESLRGSTGCGCFQTREGSRAARTDRESGEDKGCRGKQRCRGCSPQGRSEPSSRSEGSGVAAGIS